MSGWEHEPRDEINTLRLQAGPASLFDGGSSLGKLIGRQLASPIGFDSLFHLTVSTWKAKSRA